MARAIYRAMVVFLLISVYSAIRHPEEMTTTDDAWVMGFSVVAWLCATLTVRDRL